LSRDARREWLGPSFGPSLGSESDGCFGGDDAEAEAFDQVEVHDVAVVAVVPDGDVVTRFEEEVAAAEADDRAAADPRRPDEGATEDLAQVIEQRVTAML
jgi:hypothetical protein